MSELKAEIDKLNQTLSKVKVLIINNRLYIRGRFPSPETGKKVRTSLATGCIANKAGLKIAALRAKEMDLALLSDKFDWNNYRENTDNKVTAPAPKTVGEWIDEFEKEFWRKTPQTEKKKYYYNGTYRIVFKHLPRDKQLSIDLLIDTACEATSPNGSVRYLACRRSYPALAQFANLPESEIKRLKSYAGTYRPSRPINEKTLPSDEQILEIWKKVDQPGWGYIYGLLAIYGIRPHEVYHCKLVGSNPVMLEVAEDTKTGRRFAFPAIADCWKEMLPLVPAPVEYSGSKEFPCTSTFHARLCEDTGAPFSCYALRHSYARRMFLQGHHSDLIAKSMGHSEALHHKAYRAWWGQEPYNARYLQTMKHWREQNPHALELPLVVSVDPEEASET